MKPIDTLKKLVKHALNVGTPPAKKVLYEEVIKKEQSNTSKINPLQVKKENKKEVPEVSIKTEAKIEAKKTAVKKTAVKAPAKKKVSTAKKVATVKKPTVKKAPAKKVKTTVKTAPKRSKRDEKIALYTKDIQKHFAEVDEAFLAIIVKNLGPSIYRKNAEIVSCSDPKELDTVRRNFLIKKLGMTEENTILDGFIQDVCQELKDVPNKYRATFYYRLAKNLKKESALS